MKWHHTTQRKPELGPTELPPLDEKGFPKYRGKKRGRKPKEKKRKKRPIVPNKNTLDTHSSCRRFNPLPNRNTQIFLPRSSLALSQGDGRTWKWTVEPPGRNEPANPLTTAQQNLQTVLETKIGSKRPQPVHISRIQLRKTWIIWRF